MIFFSLRLWFEIDEHEQVIEMFPRFKKEPQADIRLHLRRYIKQYIGNLSSRRRDRRTFGRGHWGKEKVRLVSFSSSIVPDYTHSLP